MLAIIDTNYFIKNKLSDKPFEKGYLTTLILNEIKDKTSKELHSFYSYKLEIKDPKEETIALVFNEIKSKNLCLSEADISFVALCLEFHDEYFNTWLGENTQKVEFLTEDRGILAALSYLGINSDDFFEPKQFKFRCHACFTIYDEQRDFCKKCGYNTVVRVTVSYSDKMVLHLKKDFKPKNKELKINGKVIYSADQKEYKNYLKEKNKKEKRYQKIYETFNK